MSAVEGKADMADPHPECPLLTQANIADISKAQPLAVHTLLKKQALQVNLGLADSAAQRRGGLHIAGS